MEACQTYDDLPDEWDDLEPARCRTLIVAEGRLFKVRAIEPTDREGLLALFTRLSPESRYRRFLGPKPRLTSRELAYLTEVDHVDHEALVALDVRDGSIVAVARYARVPDALAVADVSMVVADDMQRMGIGTRLGWLLRAVARANGIDFLVADTLSDNRPARALLRRLGFRPRARHGYQMEFALPLAPARKESFRPGVSVVEQVI